MEMEHRGRVGMLCCVGRKAEARKVIGGVVGHILIFCVLFCFVFDKSNKPSHHLTNLTYFLFLWTYKIITYLA